MIFCPFESFFGALETGIDIRDPKKLRTVEIHPWQHLWSFNLKRKVFELVSLFFAYIFVFFFFVFFFLASREKRATVLLADGGGTIQLRNR